MGICRHKRLLVVMSLLAIGVLVLLSFLLLWDRPFVSQWICVSEKDKGGVFIYLLGLNPADHDGSETVRRERSSLRNWARLEKGKRSIWIWFRSPNDYYVEYIERDLDQWADGKEGNAEGPAPHHMIAEDLQGFSEQSSHKWVLSRIRGKDEFTYSYNLEDTGSSPNADEWRLASFDYTVLGNDVVPVRISPKGEIVPIGKSDPEYTKAVTRLSKDISQKTVRIKGMLSAFEWRHSPESVVGKEKVEDYLRHQLERQTYESETKKARDIYNGCGRGMEELLSQIEMACPELSSFG